MIIRYIKIYTVALNKVDGYNKYCPTDQFTYSKCIKTRKFKNFNSPYSERKFKRDHICYENIRPWKEKKRKEKTKWSIYLSSILTFPFPCTVNSPTIMKHRSRAFTHVRSNLIHKSETYMIFFREVVHFIIKFSWN